MNKHLYLLFILNLSYSVSAQSKKEQITLLSQQLDSVNLVLNNERQLNNSRIKFLEEGLSQKDTELFNKNTEIKTFKRKLELTIDTLNQKERSITKIKSEMDLKQDSIKLLLKTNDILLRSNHKLFLFENIAKVDSWVDSSSVIGILNGKSIEFYDIAEDYTVQELTRNEYIQNGIPINATSGFQLGYTGGEGILFSTIENGFLNIYKGGRGETEMELGLSYEIELVDRIKLFDRN
jgi:hypothetical protein